LRALTISALAAALTIGALAATTAPASALAAPGDLKSDIRNSSTAVLSWGAVKKATSYELQVDAASSFASPDFTAKTTNTKAVPTKALIPGKNFWRVRSVSGSTKSDWVNGSFTVAPVTTPIPLSPENGSVLQQPQSPPLLQWSSSQGAISYKVEVDADSDLIDAKVYTTKTTSLVVPDPLTVGDWYWRVIADKGDGLVSLPSTTARFDISPLAQPQISYPPNDVNAEIEDVVVDWTPVPGAAYYDVQIALDPDFNNISNSITNVRSTRYSPPVTLNNDQFWWRVRAVDLAGQPTPWTASLFGFKRRWPDAPQAVYPLGTEGTPGTMGTKPFFQWTPVKHASSYELDVSTNVNFSPSGNVTKTCKTAATTYTPRASGDCAFPTGTLVYWRVRPIDGPYPVGDGLPGLYSTPQKVTYTQPPRLGTDGDWDNQALVTGLKIALDGSGAVGGGGCTPSGLNDICNGVPSTPVLSWNPVPGANFYYVYYAQDEDFTTTEIPAVPATTNTVFQLRLSDSLAQLPESQVGSAYYWHVRPCLTSADCGPDPESHVTLSDTRAFRKASPAIAGVSSTDPSGTEITFSWQDYYNTNRAVAYGGELGNQTAKTYRLQVDNDPSFSSPIDTRIVDQATVTAYDDLYPEGTYFWRVQARDFENQGLTWSPVQTFTKSSPAVSPSSPVGGVQVPGTTPFRWAAQPFAASYTVEAYRNNDQSFSAANKVFSATVKTTAYAPPSPIPAAGTPYVWRVRRNDVSGNPGPWSGAQSFFSSGVAPNLLSPKAGIWLKNAGALFEWTEVPGAATYRLNITGSSSSSVTTVATAYAPSAQKSGSYAWSVTAYDGAGNPLATSATRSYKVDATAPFIKKFAPELGDLKPKSTIKATFSEKVRGISGKSIKMYKAKGKKWVKIGVKIKSLKKGKVASIDPKGRLKPGDYQIRFSTKLIKDVHGNNLVPSNVESLTSARVRTDLHVGR
jgi:hypothetical protein